MTNFDLSWDSDALDVERTNVDYLKLEHGTNNVRIVSKPSKIDLHYEDRLDGTKARVVCLGAKCPICKAGRKAQSRFQVKVIDRKTGQVKVLETGKQVVNNIKKIALDPDFGDPQNYDIKIMKEGTGRDTTYNVIPSPKREPLTEEEKEAVANSPAIADLNKIKSVEEIYEMQLACLSDSLSDLASDDDIMGDDADWDDL